MRTFFLFACALIAVSGCLLLAAELRATSADADHWRDAYLRAAADSRELHDDIRRLREFTP